MEPRVRRSIQQGLRAANQSIPGMAVLAAWWLLAWLLMGLVAMGTNVPPALWQEPDLTQQSAQAPTPAPQAAAQPNAAPTSAAQTDSTSTQAAAPAAAPEADRAEASQTTTEARERLALEWLSRAWPSLLAAFLALMAMNLWLQGGQIGYVAGIVQGHPTGVSQFWVSGGRAFAALAGATLLAMAASGLLALALFLLGGVLSALSAIVPGWLTGLFGLLAMVGTLTGLVWLGVRVTFWFVGIVLDRLGPLAALNASFHATRGRWWNVFQLGAALGGLAVGVLGVIRLVAWAAGLLGGPVGLLAVVLAMILNVLANLYLSFLIVASLIRFYLDMKSAPAPAAGINTS